MKNEWFLCNLLKRLILRVKKLVDFSIFEWLWVALELLIFLSRSVSEHSFGNHFFNHYLLFNLNLDFFFVFFDFYNNLCVFSFHSLNFGDSTFVFHELSSCIISPCNLFVQKLWELVVSHLEISVFSVDSFKSDSSFVNEVVNLSSVATFVSWVEFLLKIKDDLFNLTIFSVLSEQ